MFKVLAITLIAAIANPFCCCNTGFASSITASSPAMGSGEHACCGLTDSPTEQGAGDQEQDSKDCSHQAERENQLNQVTSPSHSLSKPLAVVAEFLHNPGHRIIIIGLGLKLKPYFEGNLLLPPSTYVSWYCVNLN